MGLNNNYGIKTLDRNGDIALNGKWPIFGFDVNKINTTFRSTRIIDNKTNNFYSSGNMEPSYTSQNILYGTVKELVTSYAHGYDFRPMGYYTITGTLNMSSAVIFNQKSSSGYGGDYEIEGNEIICSSRALYPTINEFTPLGYYTSNPGSGGGFGTVVYNLGCSVGTASSNTIVLPSTNPNYPYTVNGIVDYQDPKGMAAYISVEIDAENVYIYKNYRWYDEWSRYLIIGLDVSDRVRMVAQTTGSVFDVNVYLTPHKIEEMIINE